MRNPDEEDDEDIRTYATVFERLTTGSASPPLTRPQQLIEHGRRHVAALGERVSNALRQLRPHLPARTAVPLHREPSIFIGLAAFAFAFTVAWWTGGPTSAARDRGEALVVEQALPARGASLATDDRALDAAWDAGRVLRTPGTSEATQLAVVDELSKDPGADATRALLAGVDSDSLHVSMACLRALAGRPCATVATDLARRLEDSLWQRRAWAARVLGVNECAGARPHLARRLEIEPDARVQAQIQQAIDSFKEPGA